MLVLHLVRSRAILATTLFAALATGSVCRAQEGDEGEPAQPPARGRAAEDLDQWASGVRAGTQDLLESRLTMEIERIERSFRITEEQKNKLELAGRGDLKRLLDRIDAARRSLNASKGDPKRRQSLRVEIEALRRQGSADLPNRGSLFAKTLAKLLGDERMRSYREGLRASRSYRHRARVDLAVEVFDEAAGCSEGQRQRLTRLFLEEIRLPSRPDDEVAIVLTQAARLPESKLRPMFDDAQWRAVSRLLKALDGDLKHELDQVVFDDPDDAARPVAARPGTSTPRKD